VLGLSIKTKTVTLLLISLLITGLIVGGSGLFVLYRQSWNSTEASMNNQTVQLAGEVNELFSAFSKNGKIFNEDTDLQSGDPSRIQAKINTYFGASWGVDRLNFLDRAGIRIAIAPYDAKIIGDNLSDRKFFKDTISDQQSHLSEVIVSRATGVPSVIVTQPIKSTNGQVSGMVLQAIDLSTLQNFLAKVKIGSAGVAAIVTKDGSLVGHSNKEMMKEPKKISENLMHSLQEQQGHLISYTDLAGRDSVALAISIENTDWLAVVSLPTSEFKAGFFASIIWMSASLGIGLIIVGLVAWRFLLKTLRPVEKLALEVAKIGEGDLTVRFDSVSRDEVGELSRAISAAIANFRQTIAEVKAESATVAASSEQLVQIAEGSSKAIEEIAMRVTTIAGGSESTESIVSEGVAAAGRLSGVASEMRDKASELTNQARNAGVTTNEGQGVLKDAADAISSVVASSKDNIQLASEINSKTEKVKGILAVIDGIARQTNLLALNAAIEAARAGDAGRGFSVVAEEVGKLAESTEKSAKEVAEIISGMVSDIAGMSKATENTAPLAAISAEAIIQARNGFTRIAGTLDEILMNSQATLAVADDVNGVAQYIGKAMKDISYLTKDAAESVHGVAASSEEMTSQSEEVVASAHQLGQIAQSLRESVDRFNV
jgi:methyl-accepting chemotaxis protein